MDSPKQAGIPLSRFADRTAEEGEVEADVFHVPGSDRVENIPRDKKDYLDNRIKLAGNLTHKRFDRTSDGYARNRWSAMSYSIGEILSSPAAMSAIRSAALA
jgi:hypothetical protein